MIISTDIEKEYNKDQHPSIDVKNVDFYFKKYRNTSSMK